MTREVMFGSAFDKCAEKPSENYGIHGVEIRFVLKGPLGATQFLLYTNWLLPDGNCPIGRRHKLMMSAASDADRSRDPLPADLGYHSPKPLYEGQTSMGHCEFIDAECYYDGSGLQADAVYEHLVREGDAGVWAALEDEYRLRFVDPVVAS